MRPAQTAIQLYHFYLCMILFFLHADFARVYKHAVAAKRKEG